MKQPLYNQKGQLTGVIDDGRLLKSGIDPAKHQLRHPPAYAIDKEHIDKLVQQSGWGVGHYKRGGVDCSSGAVPPQWHKSR